MNELIEGEVIKNTDEELNAKPTIEEINQVVEDELEFQQVNTNRTNKKVSARALWQAGVQGKHVASKRSIDDIRIENRKANKAARKVRATRRKVAKGK